MQPPIKVTTMTNTQNALHQMGLSLLSPMLLCCRQGALLQPLLLQHCKGSAFRFCVGSRYSTMLNVSHGQVCT